MTQKLTATPQGAIKVPVNVDTTAAEAKIGALERMADSINIKVKNSASDLQYQIEQPVLQSGHR